MSACVAPAITAGTVNVLPFPITGNGFSVTNILPLTAALTEGQLDVAYGNALDATLNPNAVTKQCTIIVSARQSNFVRQRLRANVRSASNNGLFGRTCAISPPLGTKRSVAKSATTQPGVGATRSERVDYAYPGWNTTIPQILDRGTAGGAGFTADGSIDVHSDTWLASVMSQLLPEENPGQQTTFLDLVNGLEVNNPDVQNMQIGDYISFKAAGIIAPIMDSGQATYESGVTSMDPTVDPELVSIGRQRLADNIGATLAVNAKPYVKQKMTALRRATLYGEVHASLNTLKGNPNQSNQRIDDFSLDA